MSGAHLPLFWVVIPAAGIGSRMRADRPKQYLQLAGRTDLEHGSMKTVRAGQNSFIASAKRLMASKCSSNEA